MIDRRTGRISEIGNPSAFLTLYSLIDLTEKIQPNFETKKNYSLFMGVLHILDKAFLLMVNEVLPVCNIENNDIFALASAAFIPFEVPYIFTPYYNTECRVKMTFMALRVAKKL